MGKLDEKKKRKRMALLDAAYDLFISKGVNETSISDIVHRADLAKGTFYLYFKDKSEIYTELVTQKAGELFSVIRKKLPHDGDFSLEDTVICLVDILVEALDADKSLLEFIAKNLRWGIFHNVILEGGNEVSDSFYEWYTELITNSGRKFRDHKLMIYMIVELVNATCYNVILYEEPVALPELKEEFAKLIPVIIRNQEKCE